MTDLVTPYAGLTKPTVGADSDSWGGLLNGDLDLIDSFLRAIVPPGVSLDYRGPVTPNPPTGFLFEDGSAVSRTTYAALFAVLGTLYGAGDGSTTFNLPDSRNRFTVGAGAAYALASVGGAISYTGSTDGHTLVLAEIPSHNHTATDAGHSHTASDSGHVHTASDSGHSHSASDSGHAHTDGPYWNNNGPFVANRGFSASGSVDLQTGTTGTGFANISIGTGFASVGIATGHAAVTIATGTASVSIGNNGGGTSHSHSLTNLPTLPPYLAANKIIKT